MSLKHKFIGVGAGGGARGYSPPTFQSGGGLEYLLAPLFLADIKIFLPSTLSGGANLAYCETESKNFLAPWAGKHSRLIFVCTGRAEGRRKF